MSYELKPNNAYAALLKRIEGESPVVATFRMATMYGAVMEIEVDGEKQEFFFSIRHDGTWSAVHRGEL